MHRILFLCHFANSSSIATMPFKFKTKRREHSSETISVMIALHRVRKSHAQIGGQVEIPKSALTNMIHRAKYNPEQPYRKAKRAGQAPKLNARSQQALIRHDSLAALGAPSKSGSKLSRGTVRSYLKAAGYPRFKTRRQPFLTQNNRDARPCWMQEHLGWTLED